MHWLIFSGLFLLTTLAQAASVEGDWQAALHIGGQPLRLVLHVKAGDGGLTATMDSVDQRANGLAVDSVELDGSTLRFQMTALQVSYTGAVADDGSAIEGTFTQGSATFPLTFRKLGAGEQAAALKRPQVPTKPYPYQEKEVTFAGGADSVALAGTLTMPPGDGPFPAVVLVTGSGPQDRNESIAGHQPFLVLADFLTRSGIAVLRYDDRGTAKSTGSFATATTVDFADDAAAALAYLRTQEKIAAARSGIVGHSEGANAAAMVAARENPPAFVVLLGCSGVTGDRILLAQARSALAMAGQPAAAIAENLKARGEFFSVAAGDAAEDEVRRKFRESAAAFFGRPDPPAELFDAQFLRVSSPWMRYFLRHDPIGDLSRMRAPALALYGGKDTQVEPQLNADPVREALATAAQAGSRVAVLAGLNHMFQTAPTGSFAEYASIEETISPTAMEAILTWIRERTAQAAPPEAR